MTFHRLVVPSYFGGLPGGYDYVNNATSGTPAFANGVLTGGANVGSYFIGFDDDATSANGNRPALALAQNTDFLDDLMHRDIALPVRSSDSTGAPTSSVTITGPGIFMGLAGAVITDLFHITDTNDEDIDVSGTKIVAASAVDGGGSPVSIGGGFSSGNVDVTFNIPIPSGQGFRIYYAERSNWATFPADGLTNTRIRNLTEVDYQVEELFRLLHGNNEAWNAAWDSTIWDLTARGLDGAYRRSTVGVGGAFNTGGSGAGIVRDGTAPASMGQQTARAYADAYQALWKSSGTELGASLTTGAIGSGGFAFLGQEWVIKTASGAAAIHTPSLYSFLGATRHVEGIQSGSPSVGTGYATAIPALTSANISVTGTQGVYQVALTGSAWFWNPAAPSAGQTAIGLGSDMLEINSFVVSAVGQIACVIVGFDTGDATGKTAYVTTLDGGEIPGFTGPDTVTVTWVSPRMGYRYGAEATKNLFQSAPLGSYAYTDAGFFVYPPSAPLTQDVTDSSGPFQQYFTPASAYFGSSFNHVADELGVALAWGSLDYDMTHGTVGKWLQSGQLLSDGSIFANDIVTLGYAEIGGELFAGNTLITGDMQVTGDLFAPLVGFNTLTFLPTADGGSADNLIYCTTINFSYKDVGGTPTPTLFEGSITGQGPVRSASASTMTTNTAYTGGGPILVDFTGESLFSQSLFASTTVHNTISVTCTTGTTSIGTIKLPFNVDLGTRFRLVLIEAGGLWSIAAGGVADVDVGSPSSVVARNDGTHYIQSAMPSWVDGGGTYSTQNLPAGPNHQSGILVGYHVFEWTAVGGGGSYMAGSGDITTYLYTQYTGWAAA